MPSATEKPDEKAMAEAEDSGGAEQLREERHPVDYRAPSTPSARGGFFHIYKSGQGYWTRMGTIAGAGLIGVLSAHFVYADLRPRVPFLEAHHSWALAVSLIFLAIYGLLVFWFTNKPGTVDFLIATDSEMKKVNWTSRKDLLGSTRVVILFMFLIAFLLFAIDIIFGYVFYWLTILKNPPF